MHWLCEFILPLLLLLQILILYRSGLGAGISATAFMRHNVSTTIVEIDPAVYKAARTFFGLPDPANIVLEDVRGWAANKRANIDAGQNEILFDIVVHDCFSGGGVPEHIYTLEFWSDLKAVMQPDGILVVVRSFSSSCHDYVLIFHE
jgi:spermidine synthase